MQHLECLGFTLDIKRHEYAPFLKIQEFVYLIFGFPTSSDKTSKLYLYTW